MDGAVVSSLQLAHNERHPVTGSPVAKVIHNFGRADLVDRAALARLVGSISRFLEPGRAAAAAAAGEVEVEVSRRMGRGCWAGSGSCWRSGPRSAGRPKAGGWTGRRPSG